jgi:TPR repeat protein
VKINYKIAAHWYRRAAEQGYPNAQNNLGVAFNDGRGVAQSYDEAVKWLRLAAAQGLADALNNLGDVIKTATAFQRTSTRRCASTNAPRPRVTPMLQRRSAIWRRTGCSRGRGIDAVRVASG